MSSEMEKCNKPAHSYPRGLILTLRVVLPIVIIIASLLIYLWLINSAPQHKRRAQAERSAIVQTQILKLKNRSVKLYTTGTVVSSKSLSLMARVAGKVTAKHPHLEPGALIKADETMVQLDKEDYELALQTAQTALNEAENSLNEANISLAQTKNMRIQEQALETQAEAALTQAQDNVVTAEYSYKIELGQQDVAKHEWSLVEGHEEATELDKELTLRKPHLKKAEADVESAKAGVKLAEAALLSAQMAVKIAADKIKISEIAVITAKNTVENNRTALKQAQLNLERTTVKAPFDLVVLERAVSLGTVVTTQTELVSVAASDSFWVEVSLSQDRLAWVTLPHDGKPGAAVVIRPSGSMFDKVQWKGMVIRVMPQLEEDGRQVRLLVKVEDPLTAEETPLLLDSFVKVEVQGPELNDVFELSRDWVHNGNQVWLRNGKGRLEIKEITPLWSDDETILIAEGLEVGQELIVSDLSSPVPEMKVITVAESEKARKKASLSEQSAD